MKLILVKFDERLYPVLATTPVIVFKRSVVPEGGLTNPIVIKRVDDVLKPETEKPGTNWFDVLCKKEVEIGVDTVCEYTVAILNNVKRITQKSFLIKVDVFLSSRCS